MKEVIASTNSNLTMSLLKLLDCFFIPFLPREVQIKQWSRRLAPGPCSPYLGCKRHLNPTPSPHPHFLEELGSLPTDQKPTPSHVLQGNKLHAHLGVPLLP